jgi:GMP synthase (glutamine-hydrolysing)
VEETHPIRMTVVQPDEQCDLDRMGQWLLADGVELHVIRPFAGESVPTSTRDHGLIVLGGAMGALDEGAFPYLRDIKALLRATVASEIPTLGVCLGAQLLADALGGEVSVGEAGLESGVVDVRLLPAADGDPLLADMPSEFRMPALHFDAVTRLPEGAVLLGTGDPYPNQLFRIRSAWGVQFHPEISPSRFREWRDEVPETLLAQVDAQAVEFARMDTLISDHARDLAGAFAGVVREHATSIAIRPSGHRFV